VDKTGSEKMEGWQARTEEVSEFIATEGFDEQLRQVIQFQINFGNENSEQQERVWDSIKSMIRGLDGSPVRRGKKSNLPASVNVAIDNVVGDVASLHSNFFNSNPLLQAVLLKHGKSGGGAYASGDAYGASIGKKTRTLLKRMYDEGTWNGEVGGLTASVMISDSHDEEE
tara:strand:+ start:403 stop:912 length:510 start_codon:yes stop_codon:yes gene_type:complete